MLHDIRPPLTYFQDLHDCFALNDSIISRFIKNAREIFYFFQIKSEAISQIFEYQRFKEVNLRMKIISKSRIGMGSDKLDCDEFMKNQNKIRATLLRIMRNSAGVRLRCSEIF